jgi:hypothetical protein
METRKCKFQAVRWIFDNFKVQLLKRFPGMDISMRLSRVVQEENTFLLSAICANGCAQFISWHVGISSTCYSLRES